MTLEQQQKLERVNRPDVRPDEGNDVLSAHSILSVNAPGNRKRNKFGSKRRTEKFVGKFQR
jgi:hypothetical protein